MHRFPKWHDEGRTAPRVLDLDVTAEAKGTVMHRPAHDIARGSDRFLPGVVHAGEFEPFFVSRDSATFVEVKEELRHDCYPTDVDIGSETD